jgi:hypothetical protein
MESKNTPRKHTDVSTQIPQQRETAMTISKYFDIREDAEDWLINHSYHCEQSAKSWQWCDGYTFAEVRSNNLGHFVAYLKNGRQQ